jgi:NAD-dependent dihydropyrimidine dehydrogenase PreA subunit
MSFLKTVWGLLFRLFPCPTRVGLRRVGEPGRDSPVLVTCNFDLTVKRLVRLLERASVDAWLLVADSKGVNVWCAAGGDEFNTHSVVSAVKTSGVAECVDHRKLLLPPLGAPGICGDDVRHQTGWSVRWGPVDAEDLPRFLAGDGQCDEAMRRVRYAWRERLDTALGSLFPFYLLGAIAFALFGRSLLWDYLVVGAVCFVFFMLACPWLPGRRGLTKALACDLVLVAVLVASEILAGAGENAARAHLAIAIAALPLYGLELGGLASTMASELDPLLSRLGVGAVGNVALAGTVRTELLNGYRELTYRRDDCNGCRRCFELCPQGVWHMDAEKRAVFADPDACTACRACLVQCLTGAIAAPRAAEPDGSRGKRDGTQPTG